MILDKNTKYEILNSLSMLSLETKRKQILKKGVPVIDCEKRYGFVCGFCEKTNDSRPTKRISKPLDDTRI